MSLQTKPIERKIVRHDGPFNKVSIMFPKTGRTKQSMRDECDINKIMAKYQKTGAVAHVNRHGAEYGFATSDDFLTSMTIVTQAQTMFDGLPSTIRNRFANSPGAFLDFVQDANNADEMQTLGLTAQKEQGDLEDPPKADPKDPPKKTEPEPKKE